MLDFDAARESMISMGVDPGAAQDAVNEFMARARYDGVWVARCPTCGDVIGMYLQRTDALLSCREHGIPEQMSWEFERHDTI